MATELLTMNSVPRSDWHDLPPIISETLVTKFVYWNQDLQTGMRYRAEIYTLLKSFSINERLRACDVACQYTSKGIEVCITASKTSYSIWLNLRLIGDFQYSPD